MRKLVLLVVVVILAGCAGASPSLSTSGPIPTTGPTSTAPVAVTTPTPIPTFDVQGLAMKYLTVEATGEAAVLACEKDRNSSDLAKAKIAAAECRTAYEGYVAGMKALDFGPLQPEAVKVTAAMTVLDGLMIDMSGAQNVTTFRQAYDQLPRAENQLIAATNDLRQARGLPLIAIPTAS